MKNNMKYQKPKEKEVDRVVENYNDKFFAQAMAIAMAEQAQEFVPTESERASCLRDHQVVNVLSTDRKAKAERRVIRSRMAASDTMSIMNLSFSKDDNGIDTLMSYVPQSSGEMTRAMRKAFGIEDVAVRFMGSNKIETSTTVKNVLDSVMFFTIEDSMPEVKHFGRLFIFNEDARNTDVFASINGEYFVSVLNGDQDKNQATGEWTLHRFSMEDIMAKHEGETVKVYDMLAYSPSQEKKSTITGFKTFSGTLESFTDEAAIEGQIKVLEVLNIASNGMFKIVRRKGLQPFKVAVKANARQTQIWPASKDLGEMPLVAIIMEKTFMNFADGGSLYWTQYMSEANKAHVGGLATAQSESGLLRQMRYYSAAKTCGKGSEKEELTTAISRFISVRFTHEMVTAEVQAEIEAGFKSGGKYAPHYYTIVDGVIFEVDIKENKQSKRDEATISTEPAVIDAAMTEKVVGSYNGTDTLFTRRFRQHGSKHMIKIVCVAYVVLIGNADEQVPSVLCDINSFKEAVDFSKPGHMVVLDEAKSFDAFARASTQICSALIPLKQKGIDFIRRRLMEQIETGFASVTTGASSYPTVDMLSNNFYLGSFLESGAKEFALKADAPTFRMMVNAKRNSLMTAIKRLNVQLKHSGFARLCPDWSILLGNGDGLLGKNKIFCVDVTERYMSMLEDKAQDVISAVNALPKENKISTIRNSGELKKLYTVESFTAQYTADEACVELFKAFMKERMTKMVAIVFRHPKMVVGEKLTAENESLNNIIAAAEENISNEADRRVCIMFFANAKPGTCIIADEGCYYKDLLGGCDFDFDGVSIVCDREFIELVKNLPDVCISVEKPKGGREDLYECGTFKDAFRLFLDQIFIGNMGIGQITNMNQLLVLLLLELDNATTRKEVKGLLIQSLDPNKTVSTKERKLYKTPLTLVEGDRVHYTISVNEVDEIFHRAKYATFATVKEMELIIGDLNFILRCYQERTIDASKSGDEIVVLFNMLLWGIPMCIYTGTTVAVDWTAGTAKVEFDGKHINKKSGKVHNQTYSFEIPDGPNAGKYKYIVMDQFYMAMVDCYKAVAAKMSMCFAHRDGIAIDEDQKAIIESFAGSIEMTEALGELKLRYNDLSRFRSEQIEAIKKEDGTIDPKMRKTYLPEIGRYYKEGLKTLSHQVMEVFLQYGITDPLAQVANLKLVSLRSKNEKTGKYEIAKDGGSTFAQAIMPEAFYMLAQRLDSSVITEARSPIVGAQLWKDGETVTVVNGVAQGTKRPFICNKKINGEFIVSKKGGNAYIVADINTELKKLTDKNAAEHEPMAILKIGASTGGSMTKVQYEEIQRIFKMGSVQGIRTQPYGSVRGVNHDRIQVVVDNKACMANTKYFTAKGEKGKSKESFSYRYFSGKTWEVMSVLPSMQKVGTIIRDSHGNTTELTEAKRSILIAVRLTDLGKLETASYDESRLLLGKITQEEFDAEQANKAAAANDTSWMDAEFIDDMAPKAGAVKTAGSTASNFEVFDDFGTINPLGGEVLDDFMASATIGDIVKDDFSGFDD